MGKRGSRSRLHLQTAQATCENGTRRPKSLVVHGSKSRERLAPSDHFSFRRTRRNSVPARNIEVWLRWYAYRGMTEPNKGLLGLLEEESSESWFEGNVEPWLDRCLKFLEFLTAAGLASVVFAMAFFEMCWVFWGRIPSERQTRMQDALTMLNGNWKV